MEIGWKNSTKIKQYAICEKRVTYSLRSQQRSFWIRR